MSKTPKFDARTALRYFAKCNDCRADVDTGCIVDRAGRSSYPTRDTLKRAWDYMISERNGR